MGIVLSALVGGCQWEDQHYDDTPVCECDAQPWLDVSLEVQPTLGVEHRFAMTFPRACIPDDCALLSRAQLLLHFDARDWLDANVVVIEWR